MRSTVYDHATLLKKYAWLKHGDRLQQTADYLSSIGIVALSGAPERVLQDKAKIREMEARLVIR